METTMPEPVTDDTTFAPLSVARTALLITFRRDGRGVATPVGIGIAHGNAYFTTREGTGKAKRMARDPQVTLAPCTYRGRVTGTVIAGMARRLEGDEAERGRAALYGTIWRRLFGQLWALIARLSGAKDRWVIYEVSPIPNAPAGREGLR